MAVTEHSNRKTVTVSDVSTSSHISNYFYININRSFSLFAVRDVPSMALTLILSSPRRRDLQPKLTFIGLLLAAGNARKFRELPIALTTVRILMDMINGSAGVMA